MEILRDKAFRVAADRAAPIAAGLASAGTSTPSRFPAIRMGGRTLSLAADIVDLEQCLALESRCGSSVHSTEGIASTTAVPYCDFLMVRSAHRLEGVCRLMCLGKGNPVRNPLESGRFQLSPLLTAIRYTSQGVLEMGVMTLATDADRAVVTGLLWQGMLRYLEKCGRGFVVGVESVPVFAGVTQVIPSLMADHALPPALEVEARSAFKASAPSLIEKPASIGSWERNRHLPIGLREALDRGCRLAGEPVLQVAQASLEFIWVASKELLENREGHGWEFASA